MPFIRIMFSLLFIHSRQMRTHKAVHLIFSSHRTQRTCNFCLLRKHLAISYTTQNNNSVSATIHCIVTNSMNENNKLMTGGYFTSSDVAVGKSVKRTKKLIWRVASLLAHGRMEFDTVQCWTVINSGPTKPPDTLQKRKELVPKTSVNLRILTRLSARENFTEICWSCPVCGVKA
jgi:hypothetical protein